MNSFELAGAEGQLLEEIANPVMKRRDVALTYRLALRGDLDRVNWSKVNNAIADRWSIAGLRWIKDFAWKGSPAAASPQTTATQPGRPRMSLEMNPEIRARWTAALRSGEYTQGTGRLRKLDGTRCCLGVLCDLAEQAGVIKALNDYNIWMYDGNANCLPDAVMGWAGLSHRNPVVLHHGDASRLTDLNDEMHLSFAQIADVIDGGAA